MADFSTAIPGLLKREGGPVFTEDPDDPGGATKFGISQRAYPKINVRALTEDMAIQLYRADYWSKIRGDEIHSQAVAEAVFDAAVNQGPGTAARWLQEIAGVGQDGILGPVSLAAINSLPEVETLAQFRIKRIERYCEGNPKYLRGWILRALEA